jgi:sulfur carrier protein
MTQMKQFFLNGEAYVIYQTLSLLNLIVYFNYNDSLLVLEHNHLICNKKHWETTFIEDGDKIEVVTIVGGG